MPAISSLGNNLLGPFAGAAGGGQLGSALQQFDQVLNNALGPEALGQIDQALSNPATSLRPDQVAPTQPFDGPTGQVAALSDSARSAVEARLERVESSSAEARGKVQEMLTGGDVDLHNVVLASERSRLELQLTMQLRNKVIEAYQEVMRMPV
ncbi:MAG: flagellar hook-basal body complex protein FliE [Fimbriimonadaceae bacterium]|nr:flagellar hook-basal body complex protein FliE [Fimbriimonadaceae bacterium]